MKDKGKSKIRELERRFRELGGKRRLFTEQDTSTKFIMPLLEALGWDIYDFNEVREKGYLDSSDQKKGLPDCVLFINDKPYVVIESKPMRFGNIDKEGITRKILQEAKDLDAKYAVITSFAKTKIYDSKTGSEQASFDLIGSVCEYETKFGELWKFLSKESAVKA